MRVVFIHSASEDRAGVPLMRDPFGTMTPEVMGACPLLRLNVTRSAGCGPISVNTGFLGRGEYHR